MYELLAFISAYVHKETVQQNKLAMVLEKIEQEKWDGPFAYEDAKKYLDAIVLWE